MIQVANAPKVKATQKKKGKVATENNGSFKKQLITSKTKSNKARNKNVKANINKDITQLITSSKKINSKVQLLSNNKNIKQTKISEKLKKVDLKVTKKKINAEQKLKKTDESEANQSVAASLTVKAPNGQNEAKKSDDIEINSKVSDEIKLEKVQSNQVAQLNENVLSKNKANNKVKAKNESSIESNGKSKKKITVKDLRAKSNKEAVSPEMVEAQRIENNNIVNAENSDIEVNSEKNIVLGTTEISAEGEGGKSQAPVMKEASSLIKQQLKDFGNNEIVKQSRFILKDNNVGEIKLILKPESLGEVKINLNLNDTNLTGQIYVENSVVKEVFEENISSLSKALEEKGFDSANLDVSLGDKEGQNQRQNGKSKQYFSERLKKFEENGQVIRYGLPSAGINLIA